MAKEKYECTKPYVSTDIISHVDHGKTTLTAVISKVLHEELPGVSPEYDFNRINSVPEEATRGITINIARIGYQTGEHHYARVDCPGYADFVKNMITSAAQMDSAILAVAATDGPIAQTREYVLLTRQVGVPKILVALDKYDMVDDEELIELVEEEVRDLLDENDFDRDYPVIHTSAYGVLHDDAPDHEKWVQSVKDLMDTADDYIPTPVCDLDKPFLMPIEDAFITSDHGAVVTDRVECSQLTVSIPVEIVSIRPTQQTTITPIETSHKTIDVCEVDDNTSLSLRGLGRDDVECGQVVAKSGSATPHIKFEGEVYVLTKDEGGCHSPFFSNYRPQFYFRTTDVASIIELLGDVEMVQPGDHTIFTVGLIQPIIMEEGPTSAMREGGHTVGSGRVTKILA